MSQPLLLPAYAALLFTVAAPGAGADELTYSDEILSCVETVNSRLDLSEASKVRHLVNLTKRTGIGSVLQIRTSVTLPLSVRTYATYCVADGANQPVKFDIRETTT